MKRLPTNSFDLTPLLTFRIPIAFTGTDRQNIRVCRTPIKSGNLHSLPAPENTSTLNVWLLSAFNFDSRIANEVAGLVKTLTLYWDGSQVVCSGFG